jgi:guanylate kinase
VRAPDDFVLVVLVGPSGTGKSTLAQRLLTEFQDLTLSVSFTTRPPRPGEVDGRDYHFIDRAQFLRMVERGEFLEWAEVFGNLYGTGIGPVQAARRTHRGMVFDIDFQGARQVRARTGDVIGVFVLPPSMAELERRLRGRKTDAPEVIERRLRKAMQEIEHYAMCDYIVVNDSLDRAYDELRAIVLAERARRRRRALLAEGVLANGIAAGHPPASG